MPAYRSEVTVAYQEGDEVDAGEHAPCEGELLYERVHEDVEASAVACGRT